MRLGATRFLRIVHRPLRQLRLTECSPLTHLGTAVKTLAAKANKMALLFASQFSLRCLPCCQTNTALGGASSSINN